MNARTVGKWFLGFGGFLIICGLLGYLSNPEKAKTALITGSIFGLLSGAWGAWILGGGSKLPYFAAAATTLLLVVAFSWRSTASWQAYFAGEPKLFAAFLITSMLLASVASLVVLWRARSAFLGTPAVAGA
ncbi:MAG: hypothetical protein ACOC3I_02990 [Verrucomicrobiota bacterium]